jgi:hypothetical protein
MLCLRSPDGIYDLHQVEFATRPTTSAAFFARLRTAYEEAQRASAPQNRLLLPTRISRLFQPKKQVSEIHFAKFLTTTTIPRQAISLLAKNCIPTDEEGWLHRLFAEPGQAPLDEVGMAVRFKGAYPAREGLSIYDLVPRKLEALPVQADLIGWGLYFVETERRMCKEWGAEILVVWMVLVYLTMILAVFMADEKSCVCEKRKTATASKKQKSIP